MQISRVIAHGRLHGEREDGEAVVRFGGRGANGYGFEGHGLDEGAVVTLGGC
jgi:hypothetical protein